MGEDKTWLYILLGAGVVGFVGLTFAYMLHSMWHQPGARTSEQLGVLPPKPKRQEVVRVDEPPQSQVLVAHRQQPATIVIYRHTHQASIPPNERAEMYVWPLGIDEFLLRWRADKRIARAVVEPERIILTVYDVVATKVVSADDPELYDMVLQVIRQVQGGTNE